MIPELGLFALILAFCFSVLQMALPLRGAATSDMFLMRLAVPLSSVVFLLLLFSFGLLVWSFLKDDFSVAYAARNSNTLLPWYYKISAVWGAHEGSMLLWVVVLGGWSFAVAMFSGNLPIRLRSIVLSVQAALMIGFLLFVLLTSSPFLRNLPFAPPEGADLNPLLQDFGLIIHPPMLYMGYVGFSVAFSFAIAALILGRLDADIARWVRPWTNTAWAFLTVGIALGSWWAYYELGWGGWWFWDPVENASLMPWLLGTALVHSLAVSEKRNMFKRWTLLLSIGAFSLSLLGAFLVRSGILTSVHSFANDPERGLFLMMFFVLVVGGSLLIYAVRLPNMGNISGFEAVSRETGLLINNILFVLMMAVVLLGTLYPLAVDLLNLGSVSIGPPYFNLFAAIIFAPLVLLLAPGQNLRWKRDDVKKIARRLLLPAIAAVAVALVISFTIGDGFSMLILVGALFAIWILAHQLQDIRGQLRNSSSILVGLQKLSLAYWGMQFAHLGVAVMIIGVTFNVALSSQKDVRFAPGDVFESAGFEFTLEKYQQVRGPNYVAQEGVVTIHKNDNFIAEVQPQKRTYLASGQTMTEAGIDGNLWRDLYVSMGEPLEGGAWSVRLYVKPFVRWIWYGAALMAFGALVAICDKRYRRTREVKKKAENMISTDAQASDTENQLPEGAFAAAKA